jgi:hypothetical protein
VLLPGHARQGTGYNSVLGTVIAGCISGNGKMAIVERGLHQEIVENFKYNRLSTNNETSQPLLSWLFVV